MIKNNTFRKFKKKLKNFNNLIIKILLNIMEFK